MNKIISFVKGLFGRKEAPKSQSKKATSTPTRTVLPKNQTPGFVGNQNTERGGFSGSSHWPRGGRKRPARCAAFRGHKKKRYEHLQKTY